MKFVLATPAILGTVLLATSSAIAALPEWNLLADFGTMTVSDLVTQPDDAQTLWTTFSTSNADSAGVWKSLDGGGTWAHVMDSGGKSMNAIAIDPDNPTYVWAAWDASKVEVSPNGGGAWQSKTGFGPGNKVLDISIPKGNDPDAGPYRVYFATLNGIFFTNNGGTTITQISDFLATSSVAVCPDDHNLVWAGKTSGDGAMYTTNGGTDWIDIDPVNFGGKDRVRDLTIDANDCQTVLIRAWAPNFRDFVGLTEDGGATWRELDGNTGNGILINSTTGGAYYGSGTQTGVLYSSTGLAFDSFDEGLPTKPNVLAGHPSDGMTLYTGAGAGIYSIAIDFRPGVPQNVSAACSGEDEVTVEWDVVTTNSDGSPIDDLAGYTVWADVPPFGVVDDPIDVVMDPGATSYTSADFTEFGPILSYVVTGLDTADINSEFSDITPPLIWENCETGIGDGVPGVGVQTALQQNAPNPFNPLTTIFYRVSESDVDKALELAIYNTRGELVRTLVERPAQAGNHSVIWDGKDASNETVASGVYYSRLSVGATHEVRSMLLVK